MKVTSGVALLRTSLALISWPEASTTPLASPLGAVVILSTGLEVNNSAPLAWADLPAEIARLGSHWTSSDITALSLVESFIVIKYFHSDAFPALLCHKEPA